MEKNYGTINQCKECDEKLRGRSDKQFCNDSCRSAFNNRKNKLMQDPMKAINTALVRNHKILQAEFEKQHAVDGNDIESRSQDVILPLRKLTNKGFLINIFTHVDESTIGQCYRYCYDYGFSETSNGEVLITKCEGSYL